MLGDIDYNKKLIKPRLTLHRPNRDQISILTEAYNINQSSTLNSTNDLTFSLPYKREIKHVLEENENSFLLREMYLVRVLKDNKKEWYTIIDIQDSSNDKDIKNITCRSLQNQLKDKLITVYEKVSYNAQQVFDDVLEQTTWNYDYIDADFKVNYRTFTFTNQTVLDCIFSVAETYNAVIVFDTDKKTFNMYKPELFGNNQGLKFSYGRYMKSVDIQTNANDIITQLEVTGADGLGIQSVNPSGQGYLASYDYFMYPFTRDTNKNVITHSDWMSDSLCNALLDYNIVIANNLNTFRNALASLNNAKSSLPSLEVERDRYLIQDKVIRDLYNGLYTNNADSYIYREQENNTSKSFKLNNQFYYAVMFQEGKSITVNGQTYNNNTDNWIVATKIGNSTNITIKANGNDVRYDIIKISIGDYQSVGNEKEILYSYETEYVSILRRKVNNQISQVNASISTFQTQVNQLQFILAEENNFTSAQLIELNDFQKRQTYENNEIIDPQDLYDEALIKFKELQVPQISLSVDIVNFLENIGSQHDWGKLVLGNFVNVDHEPSKSKFTARITEINYDYEGKSISLTLSNIKNVNDQYKKLEKMLYDSKATQTTVDTNKAKWDKADITSNYISNLFDSIYDKIKQEVKMDINNTTRIDNEGITTVDLNDPLRWVRITHSKILLTKDGGLSYATAITPDYIIAEQVYGKIITSQRVEIGDNDGFFLIKGASATIKDRCMREVLKMGLLEESPDRFGIRINRYASTDCSNNTILNRVSVTGDDGFIIERNRNNSFVKTFYTSTDGDLFMKGNLQVGDGERVFIANAQGISVGSSSYGSAPFRVDMFGNAYMNKLTAETAVIKDSSFADGLITGGDIIGTSITLGTAPSVIKLFPDIGMWAGAEEFADAPFSVTMDGMVKATNLLVTDGMGGVLINSATNQMQMNNFDIVGAGAIDTDLLSAQIVTADDGFIADLTANRISTLSSANVNQFSNYVKIENNIVKWVTGKASGTGTQKTLSDGRPLYWIDASKTGRMTVEETSYPVLVYTMEEKEKMKWSFEGEGDTAIPYVSMGVGDGTEKGGKFIIRKPNGSVDMRYYASNTEKERAVALLDAGLNIFSDGGEINIRNGDLANIKIASDGTITVTGKKVDFDLTG